MKWFFTGDLFGLPERLASLGEEIVSTPDMYMNHEDMEDFDDYLLRNHIQSVGDFDVLVLSNMSKHPFYAKKVALLWKTRSHQSKGTIIGGDEDETEWERSMNRMPMCAVGISHVCAYVTTSTTDRLIKEFGNKQRIVLGNSDAVNLIRAVNDAKHHGPKGRGSIYG